MSDIAGLILVAGILAVGVLVGLLLKARQNYKRNLKIVETLDIVRNAADRCRAQGISVPLKDVSPAFEQLRTFAADCSGNVLYTIRELEDCWLELSNGVDEMASQSIGSTLQSSIKVSRYNKLVDEIDSLARKLEKQLGDTSQ